MKKFFKLFLTLCVGLVLVSCQQPNSELPEDKLPLLSSIEITAQPTKTVYIVGEELNTTGLEVTAVYSDESRKTVNNWKTSGFDSSKAITNQTVTISYTENEVTKTAEFNVEIKEVEPPAPKGPVLNSIKIVSKPTKLMYTIDDDFDSTGLKVEAKYNDNTTKDITENIEVIGFDKTAKENKTITVKYGDKTDIFEVNVYECILKIDFYNGSFNDIRSSYDPEELSSKHPETKDLGIVELTESFDGYYYKEKGERWILCIVKFLGIENGYSVKNLNYDNLLKKVEKNRVVEVTAYKDTL